MKVELYADNGLICLLNCVNKESLFFQSLNKNKCFTVNIATVDVLEKYCDDMPVNDKRFFSNGKFINAPIIDEALIGLECEVLWNKDYFQNSSNSFVCAKVVGIGGIKYTLIKTAL